MHFTRESIFVGTLRAFFTFFAAIIGIFAAIFCIMLSMGVFSSSPIVPQKAEFIVGYDVKGERNLQPATAPVILCLDIAGIVGLGDLSYEKIQASLDDAQSSLGTRIKGVLIHLSTPGGIAFDGASIYTALKEFKAKNNIPMYAYAEDLCASAGVYIASAADKIYTSPYVTYGNIGVRMGPAFNLSGTMDKLGIQSLTLTQGKDKDALNPYRPWQPNEQDFFMPSLKEEYERFINVVLASRPSLKRETLVNTYGAKIFTATEAFSAGLIDDGSSSYKDALQALLTASNIQEGDVYQVLKVQAPHTFFGDLQANNSSLLKGKITHSLDLGPYYKPELSGKILFLYQPEMVSSP